jgi:predicted ATPase
VRVGYGSRVITEVRFEEFRALRDVRVKLSPLTVFVGPNSSGKTSVLEGIHYLLQMGWTRLSDVLRDPWHAGRERNAHAERPMTMALGFGAAGGLSLTVAPQPEQVAMPYLAELSASVGGTTKGLHPEYPQFDALGAEFKSLREATRRALFLRLSPRDLAMPHYSDEERPRLSNTGEGLASVIADLWTNAPERRDAIMEALRRVVPSVLRVRTERARITRREFEYITVGEARLPQQREVSLWGHNVLLDTTSGDSIPLSRASEGTVLTLGLVTALHGVDRPRTLLMDDIDRALHPKAQQDLVGLLRAVMKADPALQVIATSHSPFLLDELQHEEVRVTTLSDDGDVLCGALSEHPDFARWSSQVKPGELWMSGLEEWLRKRGAATP